MNQHAVSAECIHSAHSQCTYEDCACTCHLGEDKGMTDYDDGMLPTDDGVTE